jgi:adenylosuccinate synthase
MLNGVTKLFMMKTDVLNDFEEIKIATGYQSGSDHPDRVPFDFAAQDIDPVYDTLTGWNTSLDGLKDGSQAMPGALKKYLEFIRERTNVPVIGLSYGPDRLQTLFF